MFVRVHGAAFILSVTPSGYLLDLTEEKEANHWSISNDGDSEKIYGIKGAAVSWLLKRGQIKLGVNKPILQNSILGCHEIRRQLNKLWELEEVYSRPKMSEEEETCEQHFV
ncbi:hypothetical protein EVAR_74869_1 [Eumeta japonica]|uniref:Uncharacterized protein n=1 Tax=Eumeta variegata TaxID=151549 RepID=A0A4C1SSX1_EUMVA|nr:hypothetical protein EVAR_74869_1 [Eumeta japonica]